MPPGVIAKTYPRPSLPGDEPRQSPKVWYPPSQRISNYAKEWRTMRQTEIYLFVYVEKLTVIRNQMAIPVARND